MTAVFPRAVSGRPGSPGDVTLLSRFMQSAEALATERNIAVSAPSARLGNMLREIDETVLPRTLVVEIDGVPHAAIRVSGRRLRQVTALAVSVGKDASDIESVARCLLDLALIPGAMTLRGTRHAGSDTSDDAKYSAQSLRNAIKGRDPVDRLLSMLANPAMSALTWHGTVDGAQKVGDPAYHALLRACADGCMASPSETLPQTAPLGMAFELDGNRLVVISGTQARGVAMVAARADGLRAIARWQLAHG